MNDNLCFWEGKFLQSVHLEQKLSNIKDQIYNTLNISLNLETLFSTLDSMSQILKNANHESYKILFNILLQSHSYDNVTEYLRLLSEFISYDNLLLKLKRELGLRFPKFDISRINFKENIFEGYYPLGTLLHFTSSNYPLIPVLSAIEGLMSGNVNFIKVSSSDTVFAHHFFDILCKLDKSSQIKYKVYILKLPSSNIDILDPLLKIVDAVVAWGSEDTMINIKKLVSHQTQFIEWGPKISFAYIAKSKINDISFLENLSKDICELEQQSCSSPQIIFVDVQTKHELDTFALNFAKVFEKVSSQIPKYCEPSAKEQEEITIQTYTAKIEEVLGESNVIEDQHKNYRIIVKYNKQMINPELFYPSYEELFSKRFDMKGITKRSVELPALTPSALHRTVIIQPLVQDEIIHKLKDYSYYLQTVSINCDMNEIFELTHKFYTAGVTRITHAGYMNSSYMGEPHDGVYALQRYMKKVSFSYNPIAENTRISRLSELSVDDTSAQHYKDFVNTFKLMNKEDFVKQPINYEKADLFFKSGGTSGSAKMSTFRYDEYHEYMKAAAEGLFAAGLDPKKDRVMNLFYAGFLYGGFVSFWTILEHLGACQFPMGACDDFKYVAQNIIEHNVNVLLGMPSYIVQLFENAHDELVKYHGIQKIFYGGEKFTQNIIEYLHNTFGIKLIKSASYGSVDAGPLGFQCLYCKDGEHHLHERLQYLEILKLQQDTPVHKDEIGRLVFTPKFRRSQKIIRYDIGDLGRWVLDECPCGRKYKKFELLGRHGDIARAGTVFINYNTICKIIYDNFKDFKGQIQLVIDKIHDVDHLTIILSDYVNADLSNIKATILEQYCDIKFSVEEKVLVFEVKQQPLETLHKSAIGKIINIVDLRK